MKKASISLVFLSLFHSSLSQTLPRPCFNPEATTLETIKSPIYPTDPDRFLFPILKWGPTNQVQGLFESIKLAVNTNRTLVLPPMFLHYNDKQSTTDGPSRTINPAIRINTNGVARFVSTISPEAYYDKCGRSADVVILPGTDTLFGPNTKEFTKFSGIKIAEHLGSGKKNPPTPFLPTSDDIWSTARCAILSRPYKNIAINIKSELTLDVADLPKYIYGLTNEFTHEVFKPDGFGYNEQDQFDNIDWMIHWRFAAGDWSRRCNAAGNVAIHLSNEKRQQDECSMLKLINVESVATVIHEYIQLKSSKAKKQHRLYISSPPTELSFLNEVRERLYEINEGGYKIYTSYDYEQFMNRNYFNCSLYNAHKGEILSLSDQALAVKSFHFIRWPASSWSGRVQIIRQMKHYKLEPVSIVSLLEEKVGQEIPFLSSIESAYNQMAYRVTYVFNKHLNQVKNSYEYLQNIFRR